MGEEDEAAEWSRVESGYIPGLGGGHPGSVDGDRLICPRGDRKHGGLHWHTMLDGGRHCLFRYLNG